MSAPRLTIGMASYANRDEVWFTVQVLRLFHVADDIEILVVDNFGDDHLERFIAGAGDPSLRYVRYPEGNGAAAAKQRVFEAAAGEWVLLIDSHVILPPLVISRVLEWIADHHECRDLVQGPLLYDDLRTSADRMSPVWGGDGMWGVWQTATVGPGADSYPIGMHGCGLMLSRKDSWLGFHPGFQGFGGEEGYIHEKYRLAGRQVLCLPFLRWVHLFKVAGGAPYAIQYEDRVRNYCIGFKELNLDPQPLIDQYGAERVGKYIDITRGREVMDPQGQGIKIGVIAPTYNRPDFARFLALQLANQSRKADLIAFHQNGNTAESYEWAVKDVLRDGEYLWLHTPAELPQDEWYAKPLEALLAAGCTHFYWCDHDDIYHRDHVESGVKLLASGYAHVVNARSGLLLLKQTGCQYQPGAPFSAHDPGGMSSSMCFNRPFAEELLRDLRANQAKSGPVVGAEEFSQSGGEGKLYYSDQVVRRVTMPKFRTLLNQGDPTTTYVCHPGTVSSSHWLA